MRSFLILSLCFAAFPAWIAVRAFADLFVRRRMRSAPPASALTRLARTPD